MEGIQFDLIAIAKAWNTSIIKETLGNLTFALAFY